MRCADGELHALDLAEWLGVEWDRDPGSASLQGG